MYTYSGYIYADSANDAAAVADASADSPDLITMRPLTVTASRFDTLLADTPAQVDIVDSVAIERLGAVTLPEALSGASGIRYRTTTGNTALAEPSLRGFGANSGLRVLVLVDGHKMNRPDMGAFNWLRIPISQVEKIEVLKGSQTAAYGNHAASGVIKITTKAAAMTPGQPVIAGSLESFAGSYGEYNIRADAYGQYREYGYSMDAEWLRQDGYRDHSRYAASSGRIGVYAPLWSARQVNVRLGFLDSEYELPGPLTTAQYESDPRQSVAGRGDGQERVLNFSAVVQPSARADGTTDTAGGVAGTAGGEPDSYWQLRLSGDFTDATANLDGSYFDNQIQTFSATPQYVFGGSAPARGGTRAAAPRHGTSPAAATHEGGEDDRRKGKLRLAVLSGTIGMDLSIDSLDTERYRDRDRTAIIGNGDIFRGAAALFAIVQQPLGSGWTATVGGRIERHRLSAETLDYADPFYPSPDDPANISADAARISDGWAAQAGISWSPSADSPQRFWARADRLYRYPAVDEVAAYQGYPLAEPFQADLEQETGLNIEAGGSIGGPGWLLTLTAFGQWLDDEIDYDHLRRLNVNLPDTRRYGAEAAAQFSAGIVYANIHYNWVRAEFSDTGKERFLVPRQSVYAHLGLRLRQDFSLSFTWQHTGSAWEGDDFANDQPKLPAYALSGANVNYTPGSRIRVYAGIENLFNEQYSTVKYSGVWYPSPGRTWRIGASYRF